jgi:hypothetical protein
VPLILTAIYKEKLNEAAAGVSFYAVRRWKLGDIAQN